MCGCVDEERAQRQRQATKRQGEKRAEHHHHHHHHRRRRRRRHARAGRGRGTVGVWSRRRCDDWRVVGLCARRRRVPKRPRASPRLATEPPSQGGDAVVAVHLGWWHTARPGPEGKNNHHSGGSSSSSSSLETREGGGGERGRATAVAGTMAPIALWLCWGPTTAPVAAPTHLVGGRCARTSTPHRGPGAKQRKRRDDAAQRGGSDGGSFLCPPPLNPPCRRGRRRAWDSPPLYHTLVSSGRPVVAAVAVGRGASPPLCHCRAAGLAILHHHQTVIHHHHQQQQQQPSPPIKIATAPTATISVRATLCPSRNTDQGVYGACTQRQPPRQQQARVGE